MQCNCAEGLHFSAFHCPLCVCVCVSLCLVSCEFTCNVSYTLRYTFTYVLRTCYLMGTKIICMIVPAGEGLAWVQGYSMCTHMYVHRLYSVKDKQDTRL